jgi:hypothetical protein
VTVKVPVPDVSERSSSRKVNGYVRARLALRALTRAIEESRQDVARRELALTGGQFAEARRILGESV